MYKLAAFAIALGAFIYPGIAAAADDDNKIAFNNHCRTCHSFKKDDNRLGPTMYGIYGAMAGQVKSYRGYSGSLSGIVWDETTLDKFMASPASVSTGTNMIFPPVANATERRKIIEFLKSISPR
jgi:cytochrome c